MKKITKISKMHYIKLVLRSLLFIAASLYYILSRINGLDNLPIRPNEWHWLFLLIWVIYALEMVFRFFPSKLESPGCQKQFYRNYQPIKNNQPLLQSWKRTATVVLVWLTLNSIIGLLYYFNIVDKGILILISLAYGVCDMICILFFCPFQTWIMKNRCCTTCRIYNWDFAMMFTPFIFIPTTYTWSLLGLSLLLLLRWEVTFKIHPERFSDKTNQYIQCKHCTEKLCCHKKQLQGFLKQHKHFFHIQK
mgnify:CR=1 FL=1